MWYRLILDIFSIIIGLIFGSFYNVLIYRLPRKISIINPQRSFCPVCKHRLAWKDNVPVLSYLLLRGKCRYCGAKISIIYPLVELTTAGLFLLSTYLSGNTFGIFALGLLFSGGIIITVMDFESMSFHDLPVVITAVGGIIWSISQNHLFLSIVTGAGAFGLFLLVYLMSKGGIGFGDVEYIGALTLYLTPFSAIWAVLIASVSALLFTLPMLLKHKASGKTRVPFGPFLVIGTSLAIFLIKFI